MTSRVPPIIITKHTHRSHTVDPEYCLVTSPKSGPKKPTTNFSVCTTVVPRSLRELYLRYWWCPCSSDPTPDAHHRVSYCYKMEMKESSMVNIFSKTRPTSNLPFFLILTFFYLLMVGVEGYSCFWSHWLTLTHSVEVLWTRDRHNADILPDNVQHWQQTDIHASGGIRTRNPSKWAAADSHMRHYLIIVVHSTRCNPSYCQRL